MKAVAIYLLHIIFLLLVVIGGSFLLIRGAFQWQVAGNHLHTTLLTLAAELDVFHHLFYGILLVFIILIATPFMARLVKKGTFLAMPVSCLLAATAGFIPPVAVYLCRKGLMPTVPALLTALFISANALCLLLIQISGRYDDRWLRLPRRLLLVDLFMPGLVWMHHRFRDGARFHLFLPLTALIVASTAGVPWLMNPLPLQDPRISTHRSIQPLINGETYQVEVDPLDQHPIVTVYPDRLVKVIPNTRIIEYSLKMEPLFDLVQGFGQSRKNHEIVYTEPCHGNTFFIDQADLHLRQKVKIENPGRRNCFQAGGSSRTQWDDENGIILAFTFGDYVQLSENGERITLENPFEGNYSTPVDLAIDPDRRVLHWTSWNARLYALDNKSAKKVEEIKLASVPERIVLSRKHHRLFISLPMIGKVEVVNSEHYRREALLTCFPTVRALAVDEERDLLYITGFAPYIEIRNLSDFSLVDRIVAIPWMRWVAPDAKGERLFFTGSDRLWQLDLIPLDQDRTGRFFRKHDPFFALTSAVLRFVNDRVNLSRIAIP